MALRDTIITEINDLPFDIEGCEYVDEETGEREQVAHAAAGYILDAVQSALLSSDIEQLARGEYHYHLKSGRDPIPHVIAVISDAITGKE